MGEEKSAERPVSALCGRAFQATDEQANRWTLLDTNVQTIRRSAVKTMCKTVPPFCKGWQHLSRWLFASI